MRIKPLGLLPSDIGGDDNFFRLSFKNTELDTWGTVARIAARRAAAAETNYLSNFSLIRFARTLGNVSVGRFRSQLVIDAGDLDEATTQLKDFGTTGIIDELRANPTIEPARLARIGECSTAMAFQLKTFLQNVNPDQPA